MLHHLMACAATLEFADAPPLPSGDALRLVVVGDWGHDSPTLTATGLALRQACDTLGCDAVISTGDNLYPRGFESEQDRRLGSLLDRLLGGANLPLFAVLGNHDWGRGFDGVAAARQVRWASSTADRFVLPAPNWHTEGGPVQLWGIDTTRLFFDGAAVAEAPMRQALDGACGAWRVVVGHHTFYSNGTHGTAGAYEGLPGAMIAAGHGLAHFRDHALCGRADVVLSGHDHHLEWLSACGVEWIVSGAASSAHARPGRGVPAQFGSDEPGFVHLNFTSETLEVRFVSTDGGVEHEATVVRRSCLPGDITSKTTAENFR